MTAGLFFLLVTAIWLGYIWWRIKQSGSKTPPSESDFQTRSLLSTPPESPRESDPFLDQIISAKARADATVDAAAEKYEKDLKETFADDVALKARLSQFAKEQELDGALIALWGEIKHYSAWSGPPSLSEANGLALFGVIGSKDNDTQSVEFESEGVRFTITEREWSGMSADCFADYSLIEDGQEVFGITCSKDYGEYGSTTRCISVAAFKKRGSWATMLLRCYTKIQIAQRKSSADFSYSGASEIKSKFEE